KAHAASYAMVTYQTAYLKTHYPAEFMTAVLNAEAGDLDKIAEIISECRRMKIKVMPPDINESMKDFTLIKNDMGDSVRFGLEAVKNIGHNVIEAVINERGKNGPFLSLEDMLERLSSHELNKKSLESLLKSGALDKFGERNALYKNLEKILTYHKDSKGAKNTNQSSLFSLMVGNVSLPRLKLEKAEAISLEEKLKWEKELLGLCISGHPMDKYRQKMEQSRLKIATIKKLGDQIKVTLPVMVEQIKKILTKKGDPMVFLKLRDLTDSIEGVVFPRTLLTSGHLLIEDKCVMIKGRTSSRNGEMSIICEEIKAIN
ncbi:MAG: OB-fold nucleic acid binding domain-containing protein, partial [bacterium]|nr:OB-fold nucleic acid binding domain-containing protein [bacterium]